MIPDGLSGACKSFSVASGIGRNESDFCVARANHQERSVTTPATYKEYAADCLAAMRASVLPEVKALLLAMAQQWNEFAERAERRRFSEADAASSSPSTPDRA